MSEKSTEKVETSTEVTPSSSTAKPSAPESPTTAKELDFDDDAGESHHPDKANTPKEKRVSFKDAEPEDEEQAPPPKPPRPLSPSAHAENTLVEAFPSIDAKVVKAVLLASGGKVEPAFNALLSMSDPNFENDMVPPPPPRKSSQRQPVTQMEADERYARQLADQYDSSYSGFGNRGVGDPPLPARRQQTGLNPNELDRERNFFDGMFRNDLQNAV
jgi:hypothetical protein